MIVLGDQLESVPDMREALKKLEDTGIDTETVDRWERLHVEPVENALHTVKINLERIRNNVAKKFKRPAQLEVYLTGADNFRDQVATIRPYKGNRDKLKRPEHYQAIRDYMIAEHGAIVIDGREADDEVCIIQSQCAASKTPSVICGIDKDLWQCPGWHYNVNKDGFAKIGKTQGLYLFYKQLLTGDSTDNIPGAYKVGTVAANKALYGCTTERQMYRAVLSVYQSSWDTHGEVDGYYPQGMSVDEIVLENARLLYMQRSYDDVWSAPA